MKRPEVGSGSENISILYKWQDHTKINFMAGSLKQKKVSELVSCLITCSCILNGFERSATFSGLNFKKGSNPLTLAV
jgi:hypothetical protein